MRISDWSSDVCSSDLVLQDFHLIAAGIDHRFDGEEHALAQAQPGAGLAEMQDARRCMEDASDAVAAEVAHDRDAVGLGEVLDGLAAIAERGPRTPDFHAWHTRLVGHHHPPAGPGAAQVADTEH